MLFWILTLALATLTAILLGLALLRARAAAPPAAAFDLQVFRDQLAEVERDAARGLMAPEDAARARTEISRKILDADRRLAATSGGHAAPRGATLVACALGALVLAGAFLLYGRLGAPGYPDMPIAGRLQMAETLYAERLDQAAAEAKAAPNLPKAPAPDPQMAQLMERLRQAVAARPDDPEGLSLLARNEGALGNFHAAWQAQQRLVAAKGDAATADDEAMLAEAMILAAGGAVSPQAEAALEAALKRDPKNGSARYYMGLMLAQNGRPDRTFGIWADLLDEGPETAPWIAPIRQSIAELAWLAGYDSYQPPAPKTAAPALPGPSQADVAASADMSPEDRQQMIRGMVAQLDDRLAAEGGSAQEWARLISALGVLGETDRARAIYAEAKAKFAAAPADQALITAAAAKAGVAE